MPSDNKEEIKSAKSFSRKVLAFLKVAVTAAIVAAIIAAVVHLDLWGIKTRACAVFGLNCHQSDNRTAEQESLPKPDVDHGSAQASGHEATSPSLVKDLELIEAYLNLRVKVLGGSKFKDELSVFDAALTSKQRESLSKSMQSLEWYADSGIILASDLIAKARMVFPVNKGKWYSNIASKSVTWLNGLVKVVQVDQGGASVRPSASNPQNEQVLIILKHLRTGEIDAASALANKMLDEEGHEFNQDQKDWMKQTIDLGKILQTLKKIEILL